jgi:hypothetical protein
MKSLSLLRVFNRDHMPHGIATDGRVLFVAEPLAARVAVLDLNTGVEVTEIDAGSWKLPFGARWRAPNLLYVLDAGGFPSPTAATTPTVRVYEWNGTTATLRHTVTLPPNELFGFAEDLEVLEDGTVVWSDSIHGTLWTAAPGALVAHNAYAPGARSLLAPGTWPGVTVGEILYRTAGDFAPGVGALAAAPGVLYFASTARGGIHRTPTVVADGPHDETVSAAADGTLECLKGLAFRADDEALYALDAFRGRVFRIDVRTGARAVVYENADVLDFPCGAAWTPKGDRLAVAADQEHRLAGLNATLHRSCFRPPFKIALLEDCERSA